MKQLLKIYILIWMVICVPVLLTLSTMIGDCSTSGGYCFSLSEYIIVCGVILILSGFLYFFISPKQAPETRQGNGKKKMIKLNLGCGDDIKEGYINVDISKKPGVDVVWDLNDLPLPFKENYADEILCSHILEHLINPYLLVLDINRVLKLGGVFHSFLPTNAYSLNHLRSNHTSNYLDVVTGNAIEPSFQTKQLFIKREAHGNRRDIKRVISRFLQVSRSFLYDEYEYILIKRGDEQ